MDDNDRERKGASQPPSPLIRRGPGRPPGATNYANRGSLSDIRDRGWISLREFCKVADVTYQTALRWAKLDMIEYVQVGGTKRVYEEEIRRFLQQGTRPPNQEKFEEMRMKREEYRNARAYRERIRDNY